MLIWQFLALVAGDPFQFVNYEQVLRRQTLEVYEDVASRWSWYTNYIDQVNTH